MSALELKPTHKPVQIYYAALRQFDDLGVTHETAVRFASHPCSASKGEVGVSCQTQANP